ncbi:FecR family protein [Dongia deserti]|uniref:FecR family protein n=1 Tax=Dongia deserti TaxID=2268030 RepID=UPI000E64A77B|nr:FecR family protein [Dongia deserti]
MYARQYSRIELVALTFAALTLWPVVARAEVAIGTARVVVADVSAETAVANRRLATADEVRYQELIATQGSSAAVIQFVDETELAIGERARVRLDEFVFDPGAAGVLDLTLEFGALRFSTGTMQKPAYKVSTPSATLAVRGTEFDLAVDDTGVTYLLVRHGAVEVLGNNGERKQVGAGQSLTVSDAGVPTDPRIAAALPVGALPAKIAAMDATLAGALAGAGLSADGLSHLSVLAKARSLSSGSPPDGTRPDVGKAGKPGRDGKDGKGGKRGRP